MVKNYQCSKYLVKPKSKVSLNRVDPEDATYFSGERTEAKSLLKTFRKELVELQNLFYIDARFRLLIVLQALDAGGKDGTIRNIFKGVNPQGVQVKSFKRPTHNELSRDYLWRVHQHVPHNGQIVIFNRSHYEDVLVPRVHKLVTPQLIQKRYQHIVDFERMLVEEGTVILKFYLHIDKAEQKRRLQKRLDNPQKRWKFELNDLKERKLWNHYQKAYEVLMEKTSVTTAPWYIVPANNKQYRNIVIARIIIDQLHKLKLKFPKAKFDYRKVKVV